VQASIEFKDVSLRFDNELVLYNLSFHIPDGETAVVAGPSGSGKSSILNLISGFIANYSGKILLNDEILSDKNIGKWRSQIAWLPQINDIGEGTVHEVLLQPFQFANNQHLKPDSNTLFEMLDKLKLEKNILNKAYRDISGGQQQRIGIAIATLLDKPLMLLDEPTTALDDASKQAAIDTLLAQEATILSTSHDAAWISSCNHVIKI